MHLLVSCEAFCAPNALVVASNRVRSVRDREGWKRCMLDYDQYFFDFTRPVKDTFEAVFCCEDVQAGTCQCYCRLSHAHRYKVFSQLD